MVIEIKCPVCGREFKAPAVCKCGFSIQKMYEISEALRMVDADFRDFLRYFIYCYQFKIFEKTELGEIVNLARKILLEEV